MNVFCAPRAWLVPMEVRKGEALELELQAVVSDHVGTGIKPGSSARAATVFLNNRVISPAPRIFV